MSSVHFCINGQNVDIPHDCVVWSKLIKDLLLEVGNSELIPIPDKYQIAFNNYASVLTGSKLPIDDINVLAQCFTLSNYLEDDGYFIYLLSHLFGNWNNFSYIVHHDMVNYDLKYKILLYYAYYFLPHNFRDDTTFIKMWLQLNQDINVVTNSKTVFSHSLSYNIYRMVYRIIYLIIYQIMY